MIHLLIIAMILRDVVGFTPVAVIFVGCRGELTFPDVIENPYVILNTNGLKYANEVANIFSNNQNIVAHFTKDEELWKIIDLLTIFKKWPQKNTILFVIICTNANTIKNVFKWLWSYNILNVVAICYDYSLNPTLFYSDQFVNNCGRQCEEFVVGDCNSTRKHLFPNTFRKYPNCNIVLENFAASYPHPNEKDLGVTLFLMETTAHTLNASVWYDFSSIDVPHLMIRRRTVQSAIVRTTTIPLYYDDIVWSVPAPKRIPPTTVLKIVFKPLLWISVVLTFFLTSMAWWLCKKFLNSSTGAAWCDVLLDLYSITLFGSTKSVPIEWVLRFVFLAYVIYAIHIQTAFTSNLVQILTIPQFYPPIRNLEELADSNMTILIKTDIYNWLKTIEINNSVYQKIHEKFDILPDYDFYEMLLNTDQIDCSMFLVHDYLKHFESYFNKSFHYFVDNTFSGTIRYVYSGVQNGNLWLPFNEIITIIIEAGIVQFATNKYDYDHHFLNVTHNDKIVITLEHVCSTFIIWCLGMFLAFVIFLLESFVKYCKICMY
ncbi:hypothetical protein FQR65_LT08704 [Abscondita terminalis]|nr:hypothetical protein FQR65_LT08704 [Abscondita terminalis]